MSKVIYKMIRLTAYDKYRKFTGTKKFNKNEQQGMWGGSRAREQCTVETNKPWRQQEAIAKHIINDKNLRQ